MNDILKGINARIHDVPIASYGINSLASVLLFDIANDTISEENKLVLVKTNRK